MINSCHHCYFIIYGHKRHGHHKRYSACDALQKKKRKKMKWAGFDSIDCPGEFEISIKNLTKIMFTFMHWRIESPKTVCMEFCC